MAAQLKGLFELCHLLHEFAFPFAFALLHLKKKKNYKDKQESPAHVRKGNAKVAHYFS